MTNHQILCGTDPFPTDFRAKKYKLDKHWIVKVRCMYVEYCLYFQIIECQKDFVHIMKNLPAEVSDEDVEEMWNYADKNGDGRLSYKEFKEST